MLSVPHLIVLFIVVLVVFGPQKLPELARGLGKLMAEFRKASTDFRFAFEEEMRTIERQALESKRAPAAAPPETLPSAAPEDRAALTAGTVEPAPSEASLPYGESAASESAPPAEPPGEVPPAESEENAGRGERQSR